MPAPASPRLPVRLTWLTPREQPERLLRSDEHCSHPQGLGLRQAGPIDARPRPEGPLPPGRRLRDHVPGLADGLARGGYLSALPCGDGGGCRHRRWLGEPAGLLAVGAPLPPRPPAGGSAPVAGPAQLPHHVGQHAVAQRRVRVEQHQLAPSERAAQPRRPLEVPAGVVVPALQSRHEPALHEALAGGATPAAAQRQRALQVLQGACGTDGQAGVRAAASKRSGPEWRLWGSAVYIPPRLDPRDRYRYSLYADEDWKSWQDSAWAAQALVAELGLKSRSRLVRVIFHHLIHQNTDGGSLYYESGPVARHAYVINHPSTMCQVTDSESQSPKTLELTDNHVLYNKVLFFSLFFFFAAPRGMRNLNSPTRD